ncbi:hypothetical protein FACS189492_0040 [Clostridia bacterium]|nr:hypothetical protein FACS189492_0040 [Clostridia bacterium]
MQTNNSGTYTTHLEWFRNVLRGKNVVLSHTSALEGLGLFTGYVNENQIDLYATEREPYNNINYNIVTGFDGIETTIVGGLRCTTVKQTINDMLRDYDRIDEQALVQALSDYYYSHGESFDGLEIEPQYLSRFNSLVDWAVEYYDYD